MSFDEMVIWFVLSFITCVDMVIWCRWLKLTQISLKSYSTSLKQLDSNIRVVLGSELYPSLCLKTLYICCCFIPKGSCSRFSVCSVSPSHGCFIRSWRKLVFYGSPWCCCSWDKSRYTYLHFAECLQAPR